MNTLHLPLVNLCAVLLLQCRCVLAGPAFRPAAPLNVAVWTNADAEWFSYPEQSNTSNYYMQDVDRRPNVGIAVSGGA
jgi:hypothetical protein